MSVLLYLLHLLSLHRSLVYPPSIHILYDEYGEDARGEHSFAKKTMRN